MAPLPFGHLCQNRKCDAKMEMFERCVGGFFRHVSGHESVFSNVVVSTMGEVSEGWNFSLVGGHQCGELPTRGLVP